MADDDDARREDERTREELNTGTKEVAESHRFDEAALDRWMQANVAGYAGPAGGAPVQGRPVEPDLPADHAGQEVRHAAQAARASCCPRPTRSTASTG